MRGRVIVQGLLWFGAVNFAGLVLTALVLAGAGAVGAEDVKGALGVLRGSSEAVPKDELARLREARERHEEYMKLSDRWLVESWERYRRDRRDLATLANEQRRSLRALSEKLERGLRRREESAAEKLARIEAVEAERQRREEELARWASGKVERLYRHMRAAEVARDIDRLMAGSIEDRRKAAALIGRLPERRAGEVLEALADPARRKEIYDLMAGADGAERDAVAPALRPREEGWP
jgi:flagellar motility protein MotE (MotC chaperone)